MNRATGTFQTKTWDETPYNEIEGGDKLTRATMTDVFTGDIEGDATVGYVMAYQGNGIAIYAGFERVVGRIGDRRGSFVLEHHGVFAGDTATGSVTVVRASATGDLAGLVGCGVYECDRGADQRYVLDYEVP